MKKELYVCKDSPAELKETIATAQRMMDNMAEFKVKADDGSLSFADLDELTRRNNAIANEFPTAKEPVPGYPVRTNNMADLEALSKARLKEAEAELESQGDPVFSVNSLDELKQLSTMPPAVLSKMVLDAAKNKRDEDEVMVDSDRSTELQTVKGKNEFRDDLVKENLKTIHDLLYNAKLVLFEVMHEWPGVEPYEAQLHLNAKAFKGNKQEGMALLKAILNNDVEDDELADSKRESAFILATLATEKGGELDGIIELCEQDEELAIEIFQALTYANNPYIAEWIRNRFDTQAPKIQKSLVEILEYKNKLKTDDWSLSANNREPDVLEKIYRAQVHTNYLATTPDCNHLWQDPDAEWFEAALFSALISGEEAALLVARKRLIEAPDKIQQLPIYLACAATRGDDLLLIKRCIPEEAIRTQVIQALGILGLPLGVPVLIDMIDEQIKSKEHWDQQYLILESLNLITGASLPLLFPDLKEGSEDKKHEVTVEITWKSQWMRWWLQNQYRFDSELRYRRGVPFSIESCIDEMAFEQGNYWSRQYAFHELQIRTRQSISPFFADWDVKDQWNATSQWRRWWEENKGNYSSSPWLFAGIET